MFAMYSLWQTLIPPAFIPKKKKSSLAAYLVGSCNGLLCLRYFVQRDRVIHFCVCNPFLGEFTVLPRSREYAIEYGGFGFCPKTNQYKVLRFIPQFGYCDILTLGRDDDWRRLSDALPHPVRAVDIDSSYKGNLHWIDGLCSLKNAICSFNLETERYSYISLPSCLSNYFFEIGTLDGLFCVSFITVPGRFEAYVMEDYEVKESWIKRISIDIGNNFGVFGNSFSIITFLDNGVLVIPCANHPVYYDTRKGNSSHILLEGYHRARVCIPSLMSLKDVVRRENVEEVERKMRARLFLESW